MVESNRQFRGASWPVDEGIEHLWQSLDLYHTARHKNLTTDIFMLASIKSELSQFALRKHYIHTIYNKRDIHMQPERYN